MLARAVDAQRALPLPAQGSRGKRSLAGQLVGMDRHPAIGQLGERLGKELGGDGLIDEQRLAGVADPEAAALRVHKDFARHVEVGGFMHVDVAVSRSRLDDGDFGRLHAVADEPRAAAGNEHVDQAVKPHKDVGRRTVSRGDNADRTLGHARLLRRSREHARDGRTRAGRHRPAAQDAGVS